MSIFSEIVGSLKNSLSWL